MARLNNPDYTNIKSIHELSVFNLKGEPVQLAIYKGHVCIIVNIATKSPFTDMHYKQFNGLMKTLGESKGLRILAFPCNQFGLEEPGTSEEIEEHAIKNNVLFDIYGKIEVNGENASPLYKYMKKHLSGNKTGDMIRWSYTKFIVTKAGVPVERFGPEIEPRTFEEILTPYW
ncbi:phospholipid hydroperoxide glutathione peroxidase-like [Trichoplusia ni]|uniref:Glutathione peroxidase n=1 Tax=Trichoplusia ni TaxID=7111 RepID=A0A7E5WSQ8_TRINI|nr:phospholipid hydroperoxide glutathione peroxidase-like [Trichoplusia ni]